MFVVCFLPVNCPASECRRFGTLCLFHEDETECSETSAYKIQTAGNHPEKKIQHSEHGEILKSSM